MIVCGSSRASSASDEGIGGGPADGAKRGVIVSATVPETHRQAYCRNCDNQVTTEVRKPDHPLHLILTVLLSVLWGIIWIAVTVVPTYRCWRCGAKTGLGRPGAEVFE